MRADVAACEFRFSRLDKLIPRSREAKIRCLLQYYVAIHRMMMPEILNQRPLSFMQRVFRSRHTYPTLWCIQVPQALDFAGTKCFHHSSCTTHLATLILHIAARTNFSRKPAAWIVQYACQRGTVHKQAPLRKHALITLSSAYPYY